VMDSVLPSSIVQRTAANEATGTGYSADIAFTTDGVTMRSTATHPSPVHAMMLVSAFPWSAGCNTVLL
jgi:hypothetical protein